MGASSAAELAAQGKANLLRLPRTMLPQLPHVGAPLHGTLPLLVCMAGVLVGGPMSRSKTHGWLSSGCALHGMAPASLA